MSRERKLTCAARVTLTEAAGGAIQDEQSRETFSLDAWRKR